VAGDYPTLLLPASAAFAIWTPIYLAMTALAVRQWLPAQRARQVHRRTGWWLAAAGVLNAAWIVMFTQRWVVLSEIVIVALLGCLIVVFGRLSRTPAVGWTDRLLLHTPVALYAGWVTAATVVGAASAGLAAGITVSGPAAITLAVLALVAVGAVAGWAVGTRSAVAAYAAAIVWALTWIAPRTEATAVLVAALVIATALVATVAARLLCDRDPARAAAG
jgi:hypothetical protein